ncbi:ciab isoform A [Micractinium conductrix]|uniref:Ciab isoform A n=1 Tax=Micractinium conductrix TaxID=554055 RepID=A0A2P6VMQ4_9CHLO|nr:ciab isoform A [Micractinium conductrix]|eukprot:PSC75363.1 ciab isoform A [Micractinium conductrix]
MWRRSEGLPDTGPQRGHGSSLGGTLFDPPSLVGLRQVDLLHAIEQQTAQEFAGAVAAALPPHSDPTSAAVAAARAAGVDDAALHQDFAGLPKRSPRWWAALDTGEARQALQRRAVVAALSQLPGHGWDALDRCLITHAALVAGAYAGYHRAWLQAVQGPLAEELAAAAAEGRLPQDLFNRYTVVVRSRDGSGGYSQVPYATHFAEQLALVLAEFDNWIEVLEEVGTAQTAVKQQYLAYIKQYRACLAERDASRLEDSWRQLDELWMVIKHPIQRPLRCKVQPEFSLRILDESYCREARTMRKIQVVMMGYFKQRTGGLAAEGLRALRGSSAGLYYLPFLTGAALHFRFAGQSIPNRTEVRAAHGVKIFLDPAACDTRAVAAKRLALQACTGGGQRGRVAGGPLQGARDPSRAEALHPLDSAVFLVAPHELGHAIYGLDALREVIRPASKILLEESRAELAALHTLRLLATQRHLTQEECERLLCCFLLSDLRRFAAWGSATTRPYTVTAVSCWSRAAAVGLVALDGGGRLVFHHSKASAFLEDNSRLFEQILGAEDARDGAALEATLQQMEACKSSPIVRHLPQAAAEPAAPELPSPASK